MIKVSPKTGDVTRDGVKIGHVVKIDPTDPLHIRGEGQGMRVSFSLKPMWFAYDADGKQLNEHGFDTRKRAVSRVDNASKPIEVTNLKREKYFGSDREYIYASVEWEGNWAGVSRYPGERAWVMDSYAPEGSIMPHFSNGSGTRYTRAHLLQGPLHNAANAAAVAYGLLAPEDAQTWEDLLVIAKAELAAKADAGE